MIEISFQHIILKLKKDKAMFLKKPNNLTAGFLAVTLILGLAACNQNQPISTKEDAQVPLEHFQDMKFGLFIHWGLYALPAGEWKGEYVRGIGEWIQKRKEIPIAEYEKLADEFNPIKFNAEEWSQLAEDAGMKYMVITSKHHDGFAMYHSKASDYNIIDRTPFGRDPLKELAESNAKRDIGFGFYYSQAQDWHEPNASGNNWDFPTERDPKSYVEGKALPQVKELLENYGDLSLIWFDTPRLLTQQQALSLKQMVKDKQPDCLVNDRIGFSLGDYYQMGDNAIPTLVYSWKAWEIPATLNDTWGYKSMDDNWKDPKDLLYKLSDIVRKGGNYLLNVGPTAEGVIPAESQKILRTMGEWLDVNGEAIYGTRHTPFFNTGITWKCTTKPGKLYFHILNWPGSSLEVVGLESRVSSAKFLKDGSEVEFQQSGNVLTFDLPESPPDIYNTVIEVEIGDETANITPGMGFDDPQDKIVLYSRDARIRGEEARYDWNSQTVSGFHPSRSPSNELWWYHYPYDSDTFMISIEYSCKDDIAGSSYYIKKRNRDNESQNHELSGKIEATGDEFRIFEAGEMFFAEGEYQIINLGLSDEMSADLRIRKIILTRKTN
jgi:alpha-L-fucosidase